MSGRLSMWGQVQSWSRVISTWMCWTKRPKLIRNDMRGSLSNFQTHNKSQVHNKSPSHVFQTFQNLWIWLIQIYFLTICILFLWFNIQRVTKFTISYVVIIMLEAPTLSCIKSCSKYGPTSIRRWTFIQTNNKDVI